MVWLALRASVRLCLAVMKQNQDQGFIAIMRRRTCKVTLQQGTTTKAREGGVVEWWRETLGSSRAC